MRWRTSSERQARVTASVSEGDRLASAVWRPPAAAEPWDVRAADAIAAENADSGAASDADASGGRNGGREIRRLPLHRLVRR